MRCPRCTTGTLKRRRTQTRGTIGYNNRQRVCSHCGEQFATYEMVMPTVRGALAAKLNKAIRAIIRLTLEQHDLQKIGQASVDSPVQIRRQVGDAFGLMMMLKKKRMKDGKLNSLFRAQV